jgi:hypothetical protein
MTEVTAALRAEPHLGRGLDGDFTRDEVALIARFLMGVEAIGQIGAERQQRNQRRAVTAFRVRWPGGELSPSLADRALHESAVERSRRFHGGSEPQRRTRDNRQGSWT